MMAPMCERGNLIPKINLGEVVNLIEKEEYKSSFGKVFPIFLWHCSVNFTLQAMLVFAT